MTSPISTASTLLQVASNSRAARKADVTIAVETETGVAVVAAGADRAVAAMEGMAVMVVTVAAEAADFGANSAR